MPQLPYHEDNDVKKQTAFNDITSRTQQYLDGAITEEELAHLCVEILTKMGIVWD